MIIRERRYKKTDERDNAKSSCQIMGMMKKQIPFEMYPGDFGGKKERLWASLKLIFG